MKKNNLKRTLALATSAFALSAAFVGCTDYSEFSEADFKRDAKMQEYASNFVKEFGEPDPNHTWGFNMTPELADKILGADVTRAAYNPGSDAGQIFNPPTGNQSGAINVNVNQWAEKDGDVYKSYALARTTHIPGWPNEDGYYISTAHNEKTEYPGESPKGDVSEYEIQYVSWYMRTHSFEQLDLVDLHTSEFFIQQVSCDKDYTSYSPVTGTPLVKPVDGGSDYSMDYLNFKSVDGYWTHINNFNANANNQPQMHLGSNNNRNIMYVMSSGTEDFNYHSSTSTNSLMFDKWVMVKIEWDEPRVIDWSLYDTEEKLVNFLKSSKSNTFHRVGYYLCFDYQADKNDNNAEHPGMDYSGDDVYSNWIVKITPGEFKQQDRWPKRLMCEDLGNTYDFDFNDAVFDLVFQSNTTNPGWYDCVVTIQAAGGTMPIWVAIDPEHPGEFNRDDMEIHKLLGGNSSKTPVNVGGASAHYATYRVKNLFKTETSEPMYEWKTDPITGEKHLEVKPGGSVDSKDLLLRKMAAAAFKLSIYVQEKDGTVRPVSGYGIFQSLRNPADGEPTYNQGYNDGIKSTNNAPQLFNCSVDARWTYEGKHIGEAYKHFVDWVHDEQCEYRLRWDKDQYYQRIDVENETVTLESHSADDVNAWKGSWDFGPKGNTEWGNGDETWFDKSLLYKAQ